MVVVDVAAVDNGVHGFEFLLGTRPGLAGKRVDTGSHALIPVLGGRVDVLGRGLFFILDAPRRELQLRHAGKFGDAARHFANAVADFDAARLGEREDEDRIVIVISQIGHIKSRRDDVCHDEIVSFHGLYLAILFVKWGLCCRMFWIVLDHANCLRLKYELLAHTGGQGRLAIKPVFGGLVVEAGGFAEDGAVRTEDVCTFRALGIFDPDARGAKSIAQGDAFAAAVVGVLSVGAEDPVSDHSVGECHLGFVEFARFG